MSPLISGGGTFINTGSGPLGIGAPISQAATPTFSPAAGTYSSAQTVTISCATASPTIYYTTNGSTPTTASTVYSGPITVSSTETVQAIATASGYSQSAVGSAAYTITSGATQVFNFSNFAGSPSTISRADAASFSGNNLSFLYDSGHNSGGAWYTTKQPPNSFTTIFQFQFSSVSSLTSLGMAFVIQNVVSPPGYSSQFGLTYAGDANMNGYSAALTQNPVVGGIGISFTASSVETQNWPNTPTGLLPSSTNLFLNEGPAVNGGSLGLIPTNDLVPYGIVFQSTDTFQVTIVYDGSLLTMVILDTNTNAQSRHVWPLNLINTTNANGNYVGFVAGAAATPDTILLNSWSYYTGYNTRLAAPTFSVTPGYYASAQTVSLSYPSGSTCYYTTNGLLPTSASTLYTGPITVSANVVINAVAIQSGYTDSLVAQGAYQIGSTNLVNYPSGFSAGNCICVGNAYLNGSTLELTDGNTNSGGGFQGQSGAAWFPAPISISSGWSTTFSLTTAGQGMCFVIQNSQPALTGLTGVTIGSGGAITFNASQIPLFAGSAPPYGQWVTVSGTPTGSGSLGSYTNSTVYWISATNGSTSATLQTASGAAITSTPGTSTGLTFSLNAYGWGGGPTVIGVGNLGLGYGGMNSVNSISPAYAYGISPSVCIAFEQYGANGDSNNSVGLYFNGATPNGSGLATGLTFSSGITATLSYSGTTLSININSGAFTHSWTGVDIPGTVGGSTAYVGFTAGTGGGSHSVQTVSSWTMT